MKYNAEYSVLWVAVGSMLLSLLASMSLFWGYWQLNREVTFSPIETARALAQTILIEPSGRLDMDVNELLKVVGDREVEQTAL